MPGIIRKAIKGFAGSMAQSGREQQQAKLLEMRDKRLADARASEGNLDRTARSEDRRQTRELASKDRQLARESLSTDKGLDRSERSKEKKKDRDFQRQQNKIENFKVIDGQLMNDKTGEITDVPMSHKKRSALATGAAQKIQPDKMDLPEGVYAREHFEANYKALMKMLGAKSKPLSKTGKLYQKFQTMKSREERNAFLGTLSPHQKRKLAEYQE